jgi:hypothetical protein
MKEPNLDEVGQINDYANMPKFELQQRAIFGDPKAEEIYFNRYYGTNKSADIEKNNPNRDPRTGQFTWGAGGPQVGSGGAGPTYAKEHGQSNVSSGFDVLSKVIPAKDLWFDGNSINEFGYDPVD